MYCNGGSRPVYTVAPKKFPDTSSLKFGPETFLAPWALTIFSHKRESQGASPRSATALADSKGGRRRGQSEDKPFLA